VGDVRSRGSLITDIVQLWQMARWDSLIEECGRGGGFWERSNMSGETALRLAGEGVVRSDVKWRRVSPSGRAKYSSIFNFVYLLKVWSVGQPIFMVHIGKWCGCLGRSDGSAGGRFSGSMCCRSAACGVVCLKCAFEASKASLMCSGFSLCAMLKVSLSVLRPRKSAPPTGISLHQIGATHVFYELLILNKDCPLFVHYPCLCVCLKVLTLTFIPKDQHLLHWWQRWYI